MVRLELATSGLQSAQWLEHWVCNPGVASSSLTIGILTVNFSTGTRSSSVQWNHCTSRMRSQSQLRNDKYIMTLEWFCFSLKYKGFVKFSK